MHQCYVRHDMDVNDSFYAAEQAYYDEIGPKLTELDNRFQALLLEQTRRPAAEELLGSQVMHMMENAVRGFDESIVFMKITKKHTETCLDFPFTIAQFLNIIK